MASEAPLSARNLEIVRSTSEAIYQAVIRGESCVVTPGDLAELLIKARFQGPELSAAVLIYDRSHIVGAMTQAAADKIVSQRAKHSISGSFTHPAGSEDHKAHALDLYPVPAEPEKPIDELVTLRLAVDLTPLEAELERLLAGLPVKIELNERSQGVELGGVVGALETSPDGRSIGFVPIGPGAPRR